MGFKTDLQSNNIDLQTILDTINSLPEEGGGGSSGGGNGNVETCTVTVSTNNEYSIIYDALNENGSFTVDGSTSHTLSVICGSRIFIPVLSSSPGYNISGGATYIDILGGYSTQRYVVFKITANAGENVIIDCYDDD